jgi:hypothetical protein
MILNKYGQKRTATELAKELVLDHGRAALAWWDCIPEQYQKKVTARENTEIDGAISRQVERVAKFLGDPDPNRNKEDED